MVAAWFSSAAEPGLPAASFYIVPSPGGLERSRSSQRTLGRLTPIVAVEPKLTDLRVVCQTGIFLATPTRSWCQGIHRRIPRPVQALRVEVTYGSRRLSNFVAITYVTSD